MTTVTNISLIVQISVQQLCEWTAQSNWDQFNNIWDWGSVQPALKLCYLLRFQGEMLCYTSEWDGSPQVIFRQRGECHSTMPRCLHACAKSL